MTPRVSFENLCAYVASLRTSGRIPDDARVTIDPETQEIIVEYDMQMLCDVPICNAELVSHEIGVQRMDHVNVQLALTPMLWENLFSTLRHPATVIPEVQHFWGSVRCLEAQLKDYKSNQGTENVRPASEQVAPPPCAAEVPTEDRPTE